jgi:aryl-alcohol dehydrogenase-like predicted oxidoreductase
MGNMIAETNRREFLTLAGSAALTVALSRKADAAENPHGEWRNKRPRLSYRRLGRTNMMISEIICGGNTISPANYKHVVAAFDIGLNYFDTAAAYGNGQSELGYAKALKEVGRDNVFLTSKASPWAGDRNAALKKIYDSLPEAEQKKLHAEAHEELVRRGALDADYLCNYFGGQQPALEASVLANIVEKYHGGKIDRPRQYKQVMIDSVNASLKRLETDHVDIVMCPHAANSYAEVHDFPEVFEAFEQLKKDGKARFLGASSHSDPAGVIEGAADSGAYDAVMVAYNIVNGRYLDKALDKAKQADLGVIAMKVARPVNHGRNNGQPNDPRRVEMIEKWMPDPKLHVAQKCYLWALSDARIAACNSEMVSLDLVKMNVPLAAAKV